MRAWRRKDCIYKFTIGDGAKSPNEAFCSFFGSFVCPSGGVGVRRTDRPSPFFHVHFDSCDVTFEQIHSNGKEVLAAPREP